MHKIFELKEMELDQLQAIAAGLEVKGYKKMQKESLRKVIIDYHKIILQIKANRLKQVPQII